ncbi:MAG: hypothetical protein QXH80_03955 [Candidatus Nanoarchaeia archaeon]
MQEGLTLSGWIFMLLGWLAIISLNVFCFKKLFKESEDQMVSPLEIESEIDRIEEGKK